MPANVSRKHRVAKGAIVRQRSQRSHYPAAQKTLIEILQRARTGKAGLRPPEIVQLQGLIGNQATGRLLTANQQTSSENSAIQRKLDQDRVDRLKTRLGLPKYKMIQRAGLAETFDGLSDDVLESYKLWPRTAFQRMLGTLEEGGVLSKISGTVDALTQLADKPGQVMEIVGSALETGEEAAEIAELIGLGEAALTGWKAYDAAAETGGGSIAGVKDTYEGGQGLSQGKYIEGGLTTLSGLSGLAGLLPGVPDIAGIASASMKTAAGVTKLFNAEINRRALNRLEEAGSNAGADFTQAIEALRERNSFWEGVKQTALGGLETGSSFMGAGAKWGVTLGVKAVEPVANVGAYLGRALVSTFGLMQSNAEKQKEAEDKKSDQAAKMRTVVLSGVEANLIGRLRRLAELIEPDFADEIDTAAKSLAQQNHREAVLAAIKKHSTWQPE